ESGSFRRMPILQFLVEPTSFCAAAADVELCEKSVNSLLRLRLKERRTMRSVRIGERFLGDGRPVFIVAEIGINHNGDLSTAKKLIDCAIKAGCDAVKFQKRTPEVCVPPGERTKMRQTPWGYISYMKYRELVEFGIDEYLEIDSYCRGKGILWT